MRPILLALSLALAAAPPALAAGPVAGKAATATPQPEILVEDTAPVAGGIILPVVALIVLAAALASGD